MFITAGFTATVFVRNQAAGHRTASAGALRRPEHFGEIIAELQKQFATADPAKIRDDISKLLEQLRRKHKSLIKTARRKPWQGAEQAEWHVDQGIMV